MDPTTFLGPDPGAAFVLGLFLGFVSGVLAFLVCDACATVLARRPRRLGRPLLLDDRPLAARDAEWRARVREDVQALVHDAHALTPETAIEAREQERVLRFRRDLVARGYEIDELQIEKR